MKDLGKWQIISFVSRGLAQVIGIAQGYIIARVLTTGEYGIVRIALSLGASLGIYQSLGLASASTREVSLAKNDKEIFKIFTTSIIIRYIVSIPLAVGIFFFSDAISAKYSSPEISYLLKIYAVIMLFQGFQGILNSVIMGMKKFKRLFIYQVAIAIVSGLLYVPFVLVYKVNGYFYALLAVNIISTVVLGYLTFRPLKNWFEFPTKIEFKKFFRELFSISMALFFVKIIYTNWENIGPNLLGLSLPAATVGIFAFAMYYSKKLLAISDSVTDVNLAVFSEKYAQNKEEFVHLFRANFNKIFVVVLITAFTAVYWSREVVTYGKLTKFADAIPLILPIVFAYVFYSFVDLFKSSVLVPAKMTKELMVSFILMLASTVAFFFGTKSVFPYPTSMSYAMCFGTGLTLMVTLVVIKLKVGTWLFTHEHFTLIAQAIVIAYASGIENLPLKLVTFILFTTLYIWAVKVSNFVDFKSLCQKYLKRPF